MKMLGALFLLTLCSCVGQKEVIYKYSNKTAKVFEPKRNNEKQISIACSIHKNDEKYQMPSICLAEGKKGQIKITKEIFLPDNWSQPGLRKNKNGEVAFSPAIPVFSKPSEFGFTLEISANTVQSINSTEWVQLQGKIINSEFGETIKNNDNFEALNNYTASYSTDCALFSLYVKKNGMGEYSFNSGGNSYKVKFAVSAIER
jgi:hypothetical protein